MGTERFDIDSTIHMVLLPNQEVALARQIAQRRSAFQTLERAYRPLAPGARSAPLEQWQQQAAELSASRTRFEDDLETLRRSQRQQWRRDVLAAQFDCREDYVALTRSFIQFRADERNERVAAQPTPLRVGLARQAAHVELGQRVRRREQYVPRPWEAERRAASTRQETFVTQRPRTAPSKKVLAEPAQHPRGRAPPRDSRIWGDEDHFSVSSANGVVADRPFSASLPMSRAPCMAWT